MTTTPRCEQCTGPMPLTARRHARYCSGRCRTAACRARRTLPRELTSRPRWIRRSASKTPITVHGDAASSTDPATWSRYREATASKAGAGLGFVLDGDGVVCLDLDHCVRRDGSLAAWARNILNACGPTWVERSVSGAGLHVWGRGRVEQGRKLRVGGGSVEVYGTGRYIAVTGDTFDQAPSRLADLSEVLEQLLR